MEDGHHDYTAADAGHLPPPSVPQPQQPELHRSGKRTLMLLGSTATTQIWRDVTEMVRFANSKYPSLTKASRNALAASGRPMKSHWF